MVLETIYIVRHGVSVFLSSPLPRTFLTILSHKQSTNNIPQFRMTWSVDPYTVKYHTHIPTPTGLPTDPALSSYGEKQAVQLGSKIVSLDPPIDQIISSPYYRCLQTIKPGVLQMIDGGYKNGVLLESGFEEWYGATGDHREQPGPADFEVLRERHFRDMQLHWEDKRIIRPSKFGETIEGLHNRIAYALLRTVDRADREGWKSIIICTHAAAMIAMGRVLTGRMPEDIQEEDFRCYTASMSRYNRRDLSSKVGHVEEWDEQRQDDIPHVDWKDGKGIAGGWESILNADCSYLEGSEERGWHFSGDESFLKDPNAFNDKINETVPEELNENRALCIAVAKAEEEEEVDAAAGGKAKL